MSPATPADSLLLDLGARAVPLLLLAVLSQASEPLYGYRLSKSLEGLVKQGTIYPILRTLEGQGLLQSNVEPSVSGPPRRYYEITEAGRTALAGWREAWTRSRDLIDSILEGKQNG